MNLFGTGFPGFNFISVAAHLRDEHRVVLDEMVSRGAGIEEISAYIDKTLSAYPKDPSVGDGKERGIA